MSFAIQIEVDPRICLTEFCDGDVDALVQLLDDPQIFQTTLNIPSPYQKSDANAWLKIASRVHPHFQSLTNWAIRDRTLTLLGGIGFILTENILHRGEIGYWLGSSYWGQGICSKAVHAVCEIGFNQFGFSKINAHVFDFNPASSRVLDKNGFECEGKLRRHFCKNGQMIDAFVYGRLNEVSQSNA